MEITTTLLEYGAPTNTVTRQGITPLHLAAQEGNIDVVTLLLARDAPVNVGNKVRELWVKAQALQRWGPDIWCLWRLLEKLGFSNVSKGNIWSRRRATFLKFAFHVHERPVSVSISSLV